MIFLNLDWVFEIYGKKHLQPAQMNQRWFMLWTKIQLINKRDL